MMTRYIFNTEGRYVAFVQGDNLFDTSGDWIGFVRNGNLVYKKFGEFLGFLLSDDRIARRTDLVRRPYAIKPVRPIKSAPPFPPLDRLPMTPLLPPYEDVFLHARSAPSRRRVPSWQGATLPLDALVGADLIAPDGTFLGTITNNRYDNNSILNPYGPYGGAYSQGSVFNEYGQYGGRYSQYSPYNEYTYSPPQIVKDGRPIGVLSKNATIPGAVDPDELLRRLGG